MKRKAEMTTEQDLSMQEIVRLSAQLADKLEALAVSLKPEHETLSTFVYAACLKVENIQRQLDLRQQAF